MWLEYHGNAIEEEPIIAQAKGVALYKAETLCHEDGTLALTASHLIYKNKDNNLFLLLSNIVQIDHRQKTLTKSPKIVLVVELDRFRCGVCDELNFVTLGKDNCVSCGNKQRWQCEVCECSNNLLSQNICIECGNQTNFNLNCSVRLGEKIVDVYMLSFRSFRSSPPDPIFAGLNSLLSKKKAQQPANDSVGVPRLLETGTMETIERDFAIASIDGGMKDLMEVSDKLLSLANDLSKIDSSAAKSVLKDLRLAPGLRWSSPKGMENVLERFIYEKAFQRVHDAPNALLLTDLFCYFNRACSLGSFASVGQFNKAIDSLIARRKIALRLIDSVKFIQSMEFDDGIVLSFVSEYDGKTVSDLAVETRLPSMLARSVVEDALQKGLVVVDELPEGERAYYRNIFL